jgi:hypothetical protein
MQVLYIVLFLLALGVYFVPTIVAITRNCKSRNGIEVVNFFAGWTFIGWVVALAWAASGEVNPHALPDAPQAMENKEELQEHIQQAPIR